MVHRRQKYPDFTPKETRQASQAQTLTPYVDADGRLPDRLRIDLDMCPLTARPAKAGPAAHFERNDITIICETVHG